MSGAKKHLSPGVLKELLDCDADTGRIFWRARDEKWFKTRSAFLRFNSRFAEKQAFTNINAHGYFYGTIFCKKFYAHRVIWACCYGEWPEGDIDHVDGVRTNNSIRNLRSVNAQENNRNAKLNSNNNSGVVGVYWSKGRQKWVANISLNYRTLYLGIFDNIDDASRARKEAEREYGFHENHGRAA